jgi:PAS domain S-box-containing protein
MLIPIFAALLQWQLWSVLSPKTWILLYPAVFFSAAISGQTGGILATILSALIGVFFFNTPQLTWVVGQFKDYLSLAVFLSMGLLFSLTFEKFHRANRELQRLYKIESELQQDRLKLLLDAVQAGIWEWDVITDKNVWTDNLWDLYGLEPYSCEPSYQSWLKTVHPNDQEKVTSLIKAAVENCAELQLEWRLARFVSGKERWLMARGQPVIDDQGKLMAFRGIVLDISERKEAEKLIYESEERLNFALAAFQGGVWELDIKNQTTKRTRLHDQIFGYDTLLSKWTPETFLAHVLPEDREKVLSSYQDSLVKKNEWALECRFHRTDGAVRWLSSKASYKLDESGQPVALIGITHDITEHKEIQAKQRFDEVRYNALVDQAAPDSMYIHDHNGLFVEVNHQASLSSGYSKEELLTMNVVDLEQDFNLASAQAEWSQIMLGKTKTLYGHHRHKEGHLFPVEVKFGLLIHEGKRLYLALVRDISERLQMRHILLEKERLLNDSQAVAHVGSWMIDLTTNQLTWSDEAYRLYGLTPGIDSEPAWDQFLLLLHPDDRSAMTDWFDACKAGNGPAAMTFRTNLIDGEYRWLTGMGQLESDNNGSSMRMIGTVQDTTEQKLMFDTIKDSEARLQSFMNNSLVISWLKDSEGRYAYLNDNIEKRIGFNKQFLLGKTDYDIWPIELADVFFTNDQKVLSDNHPIEVIEEGKNADGSLSWWLSSKFPFQDSQGRRFVGGLGVEITETMVANEKLKSTLIEKEVLLKEVYHRVKNNLQIISSLINLQSRSIKNEEVLSQLKQTGDRVKAMALIHEKLYQSPDLTKIEIQDYINSLVEHLNFSFSLKDSQIKINTRIEKVLLDVDTAIPCGLIINELVTNAINHAFPDERSGEIEINFNHTAIDYKLVISDNGVGFSTGFDFTKSQTLGLQLVNRLVKDQLRGRLTFDPVNGSSFVIEFTPSN